MKKKPIKLVTLDTETYNGLIGGLKRIAIYDGEFVKYGYKFIDIEKYLDNYFESGYDVHVMIHNLEFDVRKIPEIFSKDRIQWGKCFVINNKLAVISTKHYTIHDTLKILPQSLKKLSKDFDVEHGKLDLWEEVEKTYPNEYTGVVDFLDRCPIDDELFLRYLGYDVLSLYEVIKKIIEISGLDLRSFVKRISTASLSRYLFKNGYKDHIFRNNLNTKTDYELLCSYDYRNAPEIEEFIRASYCGGRTEVFKPILEKQGYHYDVNSLYPSVMIDGEYPIGKPEFYNKSGIAQAIFEKWMDNHIGLGFIYAEVYIPKQRIPPLPVKMGKLVFPCGYVYGVWTYEELEYAIKECGVEIIEYYSVCHYSNTYKVFHNFVDTMYKLKEKATEEENESLRSFAKLILNVAYGYTGMSRDKTQIKDISELPKYEGIATYVNEELGYIEIPADIRAEYIQPQVASYVTSRARLVLLKALRAANENGNVYYCDTDSIVTDKPFDPSLVHHTELGKWDLESKPLKALFLRPKVYAEVFEKNTNIKFKGISKETQNGLDFEDYEHLYDELTKGVKEYEIVEKNKLMMRSIMYLEKNNLDLNSYEYRDKKMNLDTVEKRVMNYKENYTEPLYFDSLEDFQNFSFKRPKKVVTF